MFKRSRIPLLPERKRPLVFAHRGCSSCAPENTMAAFYKARECGAPGIELDIHATKDQKLVVTHDDNFLRTLLPGNTPAEFPEGNLGFQPRRKSPEELFYEEIKCFDVGSFFDSRYSSEKPPLLEEVLEEFCPAMYVDIELKSRKTKDDPLPVLLAEKLKQLGKKINGAVTVSSFNPFCLRSFYFEWRKIINKAGFSGAGIPMAIIWSEDKEVPFLLRRGFGRILSFCDYVKPEFKQVNSFSVFRFSVVEKRPVIPWTVDDPIAAKKLIALGCEGIITNVPQDIHI